MARKTSRRAADVNWDRFKPQVKPRFDWDSLKDDLVGQVDEAKGLVSDMMDRFKGFGQRAR